MRWTSASTATSPATARASPPAFFGEEQGALAAHAHPGPRDQRHLPLEPRPHNLFYSAPSPCPLPLRGRGFETPSPSPMARARVRSPLTCPLPSGGEGSKLPLPTSLSPLGRGSA